MNFKFLVILWQHVYEYDNLKQFGENLYNTLYTRVLCYIAKVIYDKYMFI